MLCCVWYVYMNSWYSAEEPHKLMFCVDDFNLYSAGHILIIEAPAYSRKCTLTLLHTLQHTITPLACTIL